MVDLTIRLPGDRDFHIVRHVADCADCHNRAAHRLVEVAPAVRAEIDRAILESATALTDVREIVEEFVPPLPANRLLESEILKQFGWLLEMQRIFVLECIE